MQEEPMILYATDEDDADAGGIRLDAVYYLPDWERVAKCLCHRHYANARQMATKRLMSQAPGDMWFHPGHSRPRHCHDDPGGDRHPTTYHRRYEIDRIERRGINHPDCPTPSPLRAGCPPNPE